MTISDKQQRAEVEIRQLRFEGDLLLIELSDDRLIGLPYQKIKWLAWLANATPDQRARWQIEPHGYAVWWDELDDGFELHHALSLQPLPHRTIRQEAIPVLAPS